jgi:hypothetical protein
LHRSTHSSQMKMKTPAGPEISFRTSCCDLKQKAQNRILSDDDPPPAAGVGWASLFAAADISDLHIGVRNILTVRYTLTAQ